jgi:hypothetical protein
LSKSDEEDERNLQQISPANGRKFIKGCSEQKMAHGGVASKYNQKYCNVMIPVRNITADMVMKGTN